MMDGQMIMRPWFHANATQGPHRRYDAVVNLFLVQGRVLVSGPITALAAASPRQKVNIFGRCMSGPCQDARRVRTDILGL